MKYQEENEMSKRAHVRLARYYEIINITLYDNYHEKAG